MGLFDFFKKKGEDVPPDVGRESAPLPENGSSEIGAENAYDPGELASGTEDDDDEPVRKGKKGSKVMKMSARDRKSNAIMKMKLERLDARMESINSLIKGFTERFSNISQQIGEVRGLTLSNEKSVSKLGAESSKAIDIVNAVKPEKIRFDYEKVEQRVDELSGKLDSNKEYLDTILEEMKELRRKAESFIGAEGLIHLQEDVKKDLMNIQQINARAKMHADKAEQLFIETEKMSNEYNQVLETLNNFESNYSSLKKDVEKMRLDFSNIATKSDLSELKKRVESKISMVDSGVAYIEKQKDENDKLIRVVEETVALSRKNQESIADIALTVGNDKIERVGDYDEKLNSVLTVLDTLAAQIAAIKKKVGMHTANIVLPSKNTPHSSEKVSEKTSEKAVKPAEVKKKESAVVKTPDIAIPSPSPEPVVAVDKKLEDKKDLSLTNSVEQPKEPEQPEQIAVVEENKTEEVKEEEVQEEEKQQKPKIKSKHKQAKKKHVKKKESVVAETEDKENAEEKSEQPAQVEKTENTPAEPSLPQTFTVTPTTSTPEKKSSFIDKLKSAIPILHSAEAEESARDYINGTNSLNDKQKAMELQNLLAEGFGMIDNAKRNELENKYLSMKSLYDSMSIKYPEFYEQIVSFYNAIYDKFY